MRARVLLALLAVAAATAPSTADSAGRADVSTCVASVKAVCGPAVEQGRAACLECCESNRLRLTVDCPKGSDEMQAACPPRGGGPSGGGGVRAKQPHIVMVLGDDIGWGNVGWNRDAPDIEVQTPNLDGLVAEGIQLTSFYAFKYCGPSRSALMSGRNPIHVNVVNGQTTLHNPKDPASGYSGIPLPMTTMAQKLAGAGYSAHAVGKWDVGMATFTHTPAGRGFKSWLGYFGHCNDYWTEVDKCGMAACPSLANPHETVSMVDLWEQADSGTVNTADLPSLSFK